MRTLVAICLAILGLLAGPAQAGAEAAPLRADGTEWVLEMTDGEQLRSAELVGAEFRLAGGHLLRLDSARQLDGASGRRWWAHELSVLVPGKGWQPMCAPHSDGTHYAIVLPGREEADGMLAEDPNAFALSCTRGALAKCLRMGYEPWQSASDGTTMRAVFNACVRMVRADYTGLNVPYTEDGRLIDVYDVHSIQNAEDVPEQAFEAGWDERGAVCVHHVRVAGKVSLQVLEAGAPRLRGNVGTACTETHARKLGALVFNRSKVTWPAPD